MTSITKELREYATVAWDPWPEARDKLYQMCDAIDSIHAQLERKNAALKAELDRVLEDRDGWMELPKDADGEPIRAGDELEVGNGKREKVKFMTLCTGGGWLINERGWVPIRSRHVKPDTWERIIYDAMQAGRTEETVDVMPLIKRCKALAEKEMS